MKKDLLKLIDEGFEHTGNEVNGRWILGRGRDRIIYNPEKDVIEVRYNILDRKKMRYVVWD